MIRIWEITLYNVENSTNVSVSNRKIENINFEADSDPAGQFGLHHSIRLEILHKNIFHDFFENFDLT